MATAKHFYEKFKNEGFGNVDIACIHRIGDTTNDIYYHFAFDNAKNVIITNNNGQRVSLDDIKGNNFEYYSLFACTRCGYMVFPDKTNVKKILTSFHTKVREDKARNVSCFEDDLVIKDAYVVKLAYFEANNAEVQLFTTPQIKKFNKTERKPFKLPKLPISKEMGSNTLYVSLVNWSEDIDEQNDEETIKLLLKSFPEAKWVELSKTPIYF